MYAVIFKAKTKDLDKEYFSNAEELRALAFSKYGCKDFVACSEGPNEIAISYWESKEQILAWKNDPAHKLAQKIGAKKWYKSYKVEIVELVREYTSTNDNQH
jgi:heme-degrading monooxygenase HmoA